MVLVLYYRNIEDNAKKRGCVFREINHQEPPASLNGGMRMFKLYYPNKTNTGRQREFDYLKGIIMVLLYNLHAFNTMSDAAILIFVRGFGSVYSHSHICRVCSCYQPCGTVNVRNSGRCTGDRIYRADSYRRSGLCFGRTLILLALCSFWCGFRQDVP